MVCQTGLLIWALVLMRYVTDQIYWNSIECSVWRYCKNWWFTYQWIGAVVSVLATLAKLCKRILEKNLFIQCLHILLSLDKFNFEYLSHDFAKYLFIIHVQWKRHILHALFVVVIQHHNGHLPLRIRAVPEGSIVPVKNALFTVENTDPKCWWLTNYFEVYVQPWYHIWGFLL